MKMPCRARCAPLHVAGPVRALRAVSNRALLSLCAIAVSTWGCNLVTGASGLVIDEQASPAANARSGPGNDSTRSGAGGGSTNSELATTSGQGGASSSSVGGGGTTASMEAVDGATVTRVVLYQGVSRPIMQDGQDVNSDTPIIEGREALLRVFYQSDAAYNGRAVTARLTIDGRDPVDIQTTLSSASSEGALSSTINFDVPGEAITVGMGYRVELLQDEALATGVNTAALYPDSGSFAKLAVETVGKLVITLVPVKYAADGSDRLPDTSAAQLQRYEDLFYAMYPVPEVQISVRAQPLSWNSPVEAGGNGWDLLLNAIADLRNQDGVANNEYYYGIFAPASSHGAYCSGGCVAGLGFIGNPNNSGTRAAIGLGYSGDSSAETAVHELGHNHGRPHAPCGAVANADPSYPYNGASIGVYGYNLISKTLYAPETFVDMMSYCNPAWISDYNYKKLYEQAKFVNHASYYVPPQMMNLSWERVSVRPDGRLEYLDDVIMVEPPLGNETTVAVQTMNGTEYLTGQFFEYDHLPGGVLYVPPSRSKRSPSRALNFTRLGQINEISLL